MRESLSKSRLGVCLFDDPFSPSGGWAKESFGSPRYVRGTGDLRTDTTWLTNIDSNTFYKMGLSKTPRFRSGNFMRTMLSSIHTELGLSDLPPRERISLLCQIFAAVMDFTFINYGIKATPFGQLNNGIRQVAIPSEEPLCKLVREAAASATQPYVSCEKQPSEMKYHLATLVFHRQSYAKEICSQPFPIGPWSKAEEGFPRSQYDLVNWLVEIDKPALIEVTIKKISQEINSLVNYGAGAGYRSSRANRSSIIILNERRWMTSVEFSKLSKHAELDINQVILGSHFVRSPVNIPDWRSEIVRCFSFGLYCENLWTSLTRGLDGKGARTPLSAWVHSIDRLLCLEKCQQLMRDEHLIVHGYGYGRITVQAKEGQLMSMPDIALRQGLIAPAPSPNHIVTRDIHSGQTMLELTQILIERRAHNLILKLDAIAIDCAHDLFNSNMRPEHSIRQII